LDGFSENLIFEYFRKSAAKIQESLKLKKIRGTLYFDQSTIMIISRSILLRQRNVSEKNIDKIETHFMFTTSFSENRAVNEIMWKDAVERGRPQMTIWHMRFAR